MKEMFADGSAGMIGLLFFFFVFSGILVWLFWPGSKEKFESYGDIPLKETHDE